MDCSLLGFNIFVQANLWENNELWIEFTEENTEGRQLKWNGEDTLSFVLFVKFCSGDSNGFKNRVCTAGTEEIC